MDHSGLVLNTDILHIMLLKLSAKAYVRPNITVRIQPQPEVHF